jgi:hypothetical protein
MDSAYAIKRCSKNGFHVSSNSTYDTPYSSWVYDEPYPKWVPRLLWGLPKLRG